MDNLVSNSDRASTFSEAFVSTWNDLRQLKESLAIVNATVATQSTQIQRVEESLEERMRSIDWSCYTQELNKACEEIKEWRESIEGERSSFISVLKQEMEDMVFERFRNLHATVDALQNSLPLLRSVSENAEVEAALFGRLGRLETQFHQMSTASMERPECAAHGQHHRPNHDPKEGLYVSHEALRSEMTAAHEHMATECNSCLHELRHDLVAECNSRRVAVSELSNRLEHCGSYGDTDALKRVAAMESRVTSGFSDLQHQLNALDSESKERVIAIKDLSGRLETMSDFRERESDMLRSLHRFEALNKRLLQATSVQIPPVASHGNVEATPRQQSGRDISPSLTRQQSGREISHSSPATHQHRPHTGTNNDSSGRETSPFSSPMARHSRPATFANHASDVDGRNVSPSLTRSTHHSIPIAFPSVVSGGDGRDVSPSSPSRHSQQSRLRTVSDNAGGVHSRDEVFSLQHRCPEGIVTPRFISTREPSAATGSARWPTNESVNQKTQSGSSSNFSGGSPSAATNITGAHWVETRKPSK